MPVVAVIAGRRKRLLKYLESVGANTADTGKTAEEIFSGWGFWAPTKGLKRNAIKIDTRFLVARGKLNVTDDGKYYLSSKSE